ncbi:MAG TPA: hypothetical protein VFB60_23870 [Ktedonobacteraceae bacterium]|nr:hypothetical protein [Ktedonobacteraceae bacterium]
MRLLLSCISTRHSALKKHWSASGQQLQCPLTVRGSYQKPEEDLGGLLCLIDNLGCTQKTIDLAMAAGMVESEHGMLITAFDRIYEVDTRLDTIRPGVITSPLFNALHSISRTRHGYLVASTGLDLLLEFDRQGEILWSWWATDHGFELTPTGQRRELDKSADHRTIKYGTLSQTTHVNSVAELPDGRILASLFHQGMVIVINRDTGAWLPVLENLDHPHSIRILDAEHFTVADTVRGRALLVQLDQQSERGEIKAEVDGGTNWLQDCSYNQQLDTWLLVDGKNSRVALRRGLLGEKAIARFDIDPEWRLYEANVV